MKSVSNLCYLVTVGIASITLFGKMHLFLLIIHFSVLFVYLFVCLFPGDALRCKSHCDVNIIIILCLHVIHQQYSHVEYT